MKSVRARSHRSAGGAYGPLATGPRALAPYAATAGEIYAANEKAAFMVDIRVDFMEHLHLLTESDVEQIY